MYYFLERSLLFHICSDKRGHFEAGCIGILHLETGSEPGSERLSPHHSQHQVHVLGEVFDFLAPQEIYFHKHWTLFVVPTDTFFLIPVSSPNRRRRVLRT